MKKLLMIPGPSPVDRRIQDEMGRETIAFGDAAFVADFKEVLSQLKAFFDCSGEVFVIAGSGTLAMEMAAANVTKAEDNVLIISHGYFGDRFVEIFEHKRRNVDVLRSEWGEIVPLEEIKAALDAKKYAAVVVTHVDTATGVMAPIAEIGKIVKSYEDTMYIVDGVCATAGIEEKVDAMGIDILLTGSQKAFGVAPGLALLWASNAAMERRASLGIIPEYYCDFDKWIPIMHDPSKYFATPPVNMIWALKESLAIIGEETIEGRYARHIKTAKAMQTALETLGFTILANPDYRAYTLSNVIYPEGTDDAQFRKVLAEEGVQVAGGLGPYAGKMFRLGHMGNIDAHDMISVIAAIERTMKRCGMEVTMGAGVAAVQEALF